MQPSTRHVRRVVDLDLESELNILDALPGDGGCYARLWAQGAIPGCLDVEAGDLPLKGSRLTEKIARALAPQIRNIGELPIDRPWPEVKGAWLSALPRRSVALAANAAGAGAGISIVVCTRGRPEQLATCLARMAEVVSSRDEVIVVDNSPTDGRTRAVTLAAAAGCPGVRHVTEPRAGLDVARNTGILSSNRPIVAFVDDDVRIHSAWRDRVAAVFADPAIGAVTGLVLPEVLETDAQYLFERRWSFNKGFQPVLYDHGYLVRHRQGGAPVWEIGAGASMAFRRDLLLRIGLFDERLDAGAAGCSGDSEIWYRILAAGGTCLYEPAIIAFHTHRSTMEGLRCQLRAYMRGHLVALLVQHERTGHRGNLRRALVTLPKQYARRVLRGLCTGWAEPCDTLRDEVAGYLDGFRFYLTAPRPPAPRTPSASTASPFYEHGYK